MANSTYFVVRARDNGKRVWLNTLLEWVTDFSSAEIFDTMQDAEAKLVSWSDTVTESMDRLEVVPVTINEAGTWKYVMVDGKIARVTSDTAANGITW